MKISIEVMKFKLLINMIKFTEFISKYSFEVLKMNSIYHVQSCLEMN